MLGAQLCECCSKSAGGAVSSAVSNAFPFPFKTECNNICATKMKEITNNLPVVTDVAISGCRTICVKLEEVWDAEIKKVIDTATSSITSSLGLGKSRLMRMQYPTRTIASEKEINDDIDSEAEVETDAEAEAEADTNAKVNPGAVTVGTDVDANQSVSETENEES